MQTAYMILIQYDCGCCIIFGSFSSHSIQLSNCSFVQGSLTHTSLSLSIIIPSLMGFVPHEIHSFQWVVSLPLSLFHSWVFIPTFPFLSCVRLYSHIFIHFLCGPSSPHSLYCPVGLCPHIPSTFLWVFVPMFPLLSCGSLSPLFFQLPIHSNNGSCPSSLYFLREALSIFPLHLPFIMLLQISFCMFPSCSPIYTLCKPPFY